MGSCPVWPATYFKPVLASPMRESSLGSVNIHEGNKVLLCYSFKYHIYCQRWFLGEFSKVRKATTSVVMSVVRSHWTDFH
jgi:hypothetical protein